MRAGLLAALAASSLLVSLLLACEAKPELQRLSDGEILGAFEQMHRQVYGIYGREARAEAQRVDPRDWLHGRLSNVFVGSALTDEYVEHFTTRASMQRDHISIDVVRVDYESIQLIDRTATDAWVEADWSVGGVVTHQNHKHMRINRYRAAFRLEVAGEQTPSDTSASDRLRISETRLRSLERVGSALEESSGFPLDQLPSSASGYLSAEDLFRSGVLDETLEEETLEEGVLEEESDSGAETIDREDGPR